MKIQSCVLSTILAFVFCTEAFAQGTSFTYQGNLQFSGQPANGDFDFEFVLFDAASAGNQHGTIQAVNNVVVSNGGFTVTLDFGSQFPGAVRFLEIRVRAVGQASFTVLTPRQQISNQPYSVKSLSADTAASATNAATAVNALQLGGIAANQYVLTGDIRLTDARSPLPGSSSYIQNQDAGPQPASNFNISGNGTAGGTLSGTTLNAASQFNIAGNRIIGNPGTNNLFVGRDAGMSNTLGTDNAFFGMSSGASNTSGVSNSFFGAGSGAQNTTGFANSLFGSQAGVAIVGGSSNSFFGRFSGWNTNSGSRNAFVGEGSGGGNTAGFENTFVGAGSGGANQTGVRNTALGFEADLGSANLTNATAIGYRSQVDQSDSIVLGGINGINGATANTRVGIGTTTPTERLHVVGNAIFTGNLNVGGTIAGSFSVPAASITGVLGPANGGTGVSSAGASGNFLRSNGTIWASAPIGATDLPSFSPFYIQNGSTVQGASNFNISGNGTAGGTLSGAIVNAETQFNLGGTRILSNAGLANVYVGMDAGISVMGGAWGNAFFGQSSGKQNSYGAQNSFYGADSGSGNTTGYGNSMFGLRSGIRNVNGSYNSFFGASSGIGNRAGAYNTTIGFGSDVGSDDLTNATAIGANSKVTQSHSLVLGSISGVGGTVWDTDVGIGTTAPSARLHVVGSSLFAGGSTFNGPINYFASEGNANFYLKGAGGANGINFAVGPNAGSNSTLWISQHDGTSYLDRLVIDLDGNVVVPAKMVAGAFGPALGSNVKLEVHGLLSTSLDGGGTLSVCLNPAFILANCSSSLRYKENIDDYSFGLELIRRFRPVHFTWKGSKLSDVGLIAEEVAEAEPRLVVKNAAGDIEGVKYNQISVVLINAVKEQQAEIEANKSESEQLRKLVKSQQKILDELLTVLCELKPTLVACNK